MQKIGLGSPLIALSIWPMLMYYYLGNFRAVAFLSYVICLVVYLSKVHENNNGGKAYALFSSMLLLEFIIGLVTFGDPLSHVFSYRLIFGFGIFFLGYVYFVKVEAEKIFLILAILTIIEKLFLIASPGLINILPNYDGGVTFSYENAESVFGGVHSFGGNRSVSGAILFAGYIYSMNKPISRWAKTCIFFASVVCMSGTALLFAALYLPYLAIIKIRSNGRLFGKLVIASILGIFFMFLIPIFFVTSYEDTLVDRFSLYYIDFIFGYKIEQIQDYIMAADISGFVFGLGSAAFTSTSEEIAGYGSRYGDFIALDFISRYGLLGFFMIFILFALTMRKRSFPAIMIILLGTLHYHVLFSGPGQVMSALILANTIRSRVISRVGSGKRVFDLPSDAIPSWSGRI